MIRSTKKSLINYVRNICSSPILNKTQELWRYDNKNPFLEIPEAWITSLDEIEPRYLEIIRLHPGRGKRGGPFG